MLGVRLSNSALANSANALPNLLCPAVATKGARRRRGVLRPDKDTWNDGEPRPLSAFARTSARQWEWLPAKWWATRYLTHHDSPKELPATSSSLAPGDQARAHPQERHVLAGPSSQPSTHDVVQRTRCSATLAFSRSVSRSHLARTRGSMAKGGLLLFGRSSMCLVSAG